MKGKLKMLSVTVRWVPSNPLFRKVKLRLVHLSVAGNDHDQCSLLKRGVRSWKNKNVAVLCVTECPLTRESASGK